MAGRRAALTAAALGERLHLAEWQIHRAERDKLIPERDRSRGWSADLADTIALRDQAELRRAIGNVPDMGAFDTAKFFTSRFGFDVKPHAVHELDRQGRLAVHHYSRDTPVFDGHAIAAFRSAAALRTANHTGWLLGPDQAAAELHIRRTDLDHLDRTGIIAVAHSIKGYGGHYIGLYR